MKVFFFLSLLVIANLASANPSSSYEVHRQLRVTEAQSAIELMDQATPDELQSLLLLPANQTVEDQTWATAPVEIDVSVSLQLLTIQYPLGQFSLPVSTARPGYHTKTGCFKNPHLELIHYSKKYENSPMPHSMFFYGGFAIHGTLEEGRLGHPASHGCVRVSRADATRLYNLVREYGAQNTQICIH